MTQQLHHLPILVDVLQSFDVPDTPELEGGKQLVFLDVQGTQVTLRLRRTTADKLLLRLAEEAR